MRKYGKFAVLIAVVIAALVWLASTGVSETKTYYKTIAEVGQMGDRAYQERLRVAGDVAAGSIQHVNGQVNFRPHSGQNGAESRIRGLRSASRYLPRWRASSGGWTHGS